MLRPPAVASCVHAAEDLHFIAKRDIFEAQQCLHADYPDYKGNKLGELNRFAGEDLLQGFGEFMNQATYAVHALSF